MRKNNKALAIISVIMMCAILFTIFAFSDDKELQKEVVEQITDTVTDMIAENESTIEIPELTEVDEQTVEVQESTENEAFIEQGQVAYEGSDKTPDVTVGDYAGLTYYSQIDNRWSNKMYSSVGDTAQTIGTSGCGPTSSAMVVSSIKGTITPDTMAELYVQHGYRSVNQGTYWSAFKWTADIFDIGYSECYKLDDVIEKLKDNHYIIASCNQGLFTYGGHFIVLTGLEGNYIKVYDPYLYNGKFDVSSRRGKAEVRGNTVYVSIGNFREYANYQKFFCFKNDRTDIKENTTTTVVTKNNTSNVANVNYTVKVTANSGLNIRNGASTSYSKIGGYAKNTVVTILAESNGWGKTNAGWIYLVYTSRITANTQTKITGYRTGNYRITASILNVRTGPGTNYKAKTYKQLTSNARQQNAKLGNAYCNGYMNGVVCTVTKVNGKWGYTASGWICLDYCTKL